MLKQYLDYLKDNPQGYWFKRKLFGWGWVPVKWQGWLVILVALAVAFTGFYVAQTDDAPEAAFIGVVLMLVILFTFGFWKGQRPRWQWGIPKKDDNEPTER